MAVDQQIIRDEDLLDKLKDARESILREIRKAVLGQDEAVEQVLLSLFVGGHSILTGVPGLAKTLLVRTIASVLDLSFKRIQFTPDLMPADITGTEIIEEDRVTGRRDLQFIRGPVFANIILADEINRTPPKTQAALLEAMQEGNVTVQGTTYPLPKPFFVLATQNPIEMEGTYPLPEAQLDRFLMKIVVSYPNRDELSLILDRTITREEIEVSQVVDRAEILSLRSVCRSVLIAAHVQNFAVDLVMATQPDQPQGHEMAKKYIRYGSSPRGAQALLECGRVHALMNGRYHLSVDDVRHVATSVLRHRIILNFDAHADGQNPDTVLSKIISSVATPKPK